MLQVTLAEYEADGIVLNPIDWTTIELSKTTENAYLFATPRGLAVPVCGRARSWQPRPWIWATS